jgi:hypothetical protein
VFSVCVAHGVVFEDDLVAQAQIGVDEARLFRGYSIQQVLPDLITDIALATHVAAWAAATGERSVGQFQRRDAAAQVDTALALE